MSVREDALDVLLGRLEGVTANVFVGETPALGPDDPTTAIFVSVLADDPGYQGENAYITLPVRITVTAKTDLDAPWQTIESLIASVKTAVETDHHLSGSLIPRGLTRGSTTPLDREAGSEFVGCAIEYRLAYVEKWGAP